MGRRRQPRPRVIVEKTWVWQGREEIRAALDDAGEIWAVVSDVRRLGAAARMAAAQWLRTEFMPRASHECCYQYLWADAPAPDDVPEVPRPDRGDAPKREAP